ncbi:hypothetical protein TNCV_3961021 [Trichonephila clavipes]|nr:hypothetical protein TNCV_3961021 [Trichonephila clavipes]
MLRQSTMLHCLWMAHFIVVARFDMSPPAPHLYIMTIMGQKEAGLMSKHGTVPFIAYIALNWHHYKRSLLYRGVNVGLLNGCDEGRPPAFSQLLVAFFVVLLVDSFGI